MRTIEDLRANLREDATVFATVTQGRGQGIITCINKHARYTQCHRTVERVDELCTPGRLLSICVTEGDESILISTVYGIAGLTKNSPLKRISEAARLHATLLLLAEKHLITATSKTIVGGDFNSIESPTAMDRSSCISRYTDTNEWRPQLALLASNVVDVYESLYMNGEATARINEHATYWSTPTRHLCRNSRPCFHARALWNGGMCGCSPASHGAGLQQPPQQPPSPSSP